MIPYINHISTCILDESVYIYKQSEWSSLFARCEWMRNIVNSHTAGTEGNICMSNERLMTNTFIDNTRSMETASISIIF